MKQEKQVFVCNQCGYETARWSGQCSSCGAWNSFEEQTVFPKSSSFAGAQRKGAVQVQLLGEISTDQAIRYPTHMDELDRVLGGGVVKGSMILLGGDPGIGKSTLLLQICGHLGQHYSILYVSGEESAQQLKLRADRLKVEGGQVKLLTENDLGTVLQAIAHSKPQLVMVDSIQTMRLDEIGSAAGSVTQVRECTGALMHVAKKMDIPIFIVGHVNKDGNIAGPKVLEHIVDAVLYFEGDSHLSFRILRAVKNRYGSTNEIAVLDMGDQGLVEVKNPSATLLAERPKGVSGSCVCSVMEGSRPIMAEVQALVTKTGFGIPRRVSTGFDYNRLALIMAVLEKRAGYLFGTLDVYINVVGGLKLDEPAVDLAVALALVSGLRDIPVDDGLIAFGELGLGGEVRMVQGIEKRVLEAQKLGFKICVVPHQVMKTLKNGNDYNIRITPVQSIRGAIAAVFPPQNQERR